MKLSVYTKKYADIVDYYQIFKQLEKREPTLSRVVVAGMLICAKYFALNAKKSEALDVLQNAAKIATESGVLRVEVLRFFTETGNFREGETYYNEFPPELKTQRESLIHYLDLLHASEQTGVVISLGNQMLKDGVRTSRVYQILIENSKKLGRSEATLQGLIDEAKSYFPKEFT